MAELSSLFPTYQQPPRSSLFNLSHNQNLQLASLPTEVLVNIVELVYQLSIDELPDSHPVIRHESIHDDKNEGLRHNSEFFHRLAEIKVLRMFTRCVSIELDGLFPSDEIEPTDVIKMVDTLKALPNLKHVCVKLADFSPDDQLFSFTESYEVYRHNFILFFELKLETLTFI